MSSPLRTLALVTITIMAFGLTSCLDYDEKLELDKDFGGRLTGTIGIGEMLANAASGIGDTEGEEDPFSAEEFNKGIAGAEGVAVESVEEFKEEGKRYLRYTITCDSLESLARLKKSGDEGVGDFLGEIEVAKRSDKWIYERKITLKKPGADKDDAESDAFAEGLAESLLGRNFFTYEVRFPSKVLKANVREFDGETNTVTWKFSLAQLAKEPAVMRAEIFPPPRRLGTFLWMLIAIASLAVIAAGGFYINFRRRMG